MSFQDFLTDALSPSWWQKKINVPFIGQEFPASFFTLMFARLKNLNVLPAPYQKIHIELIEKKEMHATLYQAPLGMNSFFWLGNLSELKDTKDLQQKLSVYQGPHHIAYFIKTGPLVGKSSDNNITIPTTLDFILLEQLAQFLNITLDAKKKAIVRRLFSNINGLNIETCCMLLQYLELMNSKTIDQCLPFLNNMVGQAPMLSTLSEAFFAQQPSRFFPIWSTLEKE